MLDHPVIMNVIQQGDALTLLRLLPAAGSFNVMNAAHQLGRNFIGCDLKFGGDCNTAIGAMVVPFEEKPVGSFSAKER